MSAGTENPQIKRRNYFVDREFQTEFILKFTMLVMAASAISAVILYLLSASSVTASFENSRLVLKSTADFILPAIAISALIATILIGIATAAVTIFMSHRIAGPMYRLQRITKSVGAGELNIAVQFRHNDEMKPIADSFNEMIKGLGSAAVRIKQEASSLEDILRRLESASKAGPCGEDIKVLIAEMDDSRKNLDSAISFFKTR